VLFRAVMPIFNMQYYASWVLVAAILWILGFAFFVVVYTPILVKPRVDGAFG
jgi:uncharacterized protein involved in response to NO